ncbi:MAG: cytochrome c oxidase assembly protein [Halieaceae bacterium]|nr:cytochrome c oxidase assembly protein [Halieaceae bacterium]
MRLFGDNPVALTVAKMAAVVVLMFSFVFVVMVPLYNVLCDALGINGKTSGQRYQAASIQVDEAREITIQFIATNSDGMPWEFRPSQTMMKVNPGAVNDTVFLARNPRPEAMVAQAIPSVSPARAAEFFHKTECFCFNNQPLDGLESTEMPLQFIVDQDLPRDIRTITLSYTMFDITEMASGAVASR